jgi:hypothetical protein
MRATMMRATIVPTAEIIEIGYRCIVVVNENAGNFFALEKFLLRRPTHKN